MARYGDQPLEPPLTWRVAFVGGPWSGKRGRYYGIEGFPDMHAGDGRYVFADVDDDGDVVYYFDDDLGG